MNKIWEYGSIKDIPLYNCSNHTSEEWSALYGTKHPVLGYFDVAFGTIINILYVPILSVMFQKEYFKLSCFKIMIFLGIVDMLALCINSIATGILAIEGAVYCTYPNFNYIVGMIILGLWCCSCIVALLLVANRLMDLSKPEWAHDVFRGYRTYITLVLPVLYGLYFAFFTNPVGFNSTYYIWIFDPMIYQNRSSEYQNIPHSINNVLIVAITGVLYEWLYKAVVEKLSMISWEHRKQDLSFQILVQSAMICSINVAASIIFVVMNFVQLPIWVMVVAQKMWQSIHGAPVIIYLLLNKSIRTGFVKKMTWQSNATVASTVVHKNENRMVV